MGASSRFKICIRTRNPRGGVAGVCVEIEMVEVVNQALRGVAACGHAIQCYETKAHTLIEAIESFYLLDTP